MNRDSLRWRVTSFYVGMLAIALIVFSVAVYLGIRTFLMRSLERSLSTDASTILSDYVRPLDSKGMSWFLSEMSESYPPGISDTFVRVSRGSEILYQTEDMRGQPLPASAISSTAGAGQFSSIHPTRQSNEHRMVLYALPYRTPSGEPFVIETGASTEPIQHILRSLLLILLIGTPVILVIAAVGGYALMSQPLRPVVTLTRKAETVGRHDLGERLPIIRSGDELERLSLALNRMIDRLEETVAHNRRFSADASHELRTPLTIIRGELEVLMQTPLPPALAEGLGSAVEETDRMSHIVESLMTIARLEGGGERMEMLPIDLTSLARVTLEHMGLLAEEKRIRFVCEPGEPVYITGDAMRMRQVIANLLDNGIKYTASGGAVRISVAAQGDLAVLRVSDTGMGIPAASLPLIFDRFYRADQTRSRESGGMGLGLSIVKSICGAHHATVSASSVEGVGTTLIVQLPLLRIPALAQDEQRTDPQMAQTADA